ncbi:TIGR03435 family protein [Telmatobacter bradus]|uniref:TIGR03435 family protein n=1 Tax=Telmatobacter bradus TaxID=474953 RepID=UPI003B434561
MFGNLAAFGMLFVWSGVARAQLCENTAGAAQKLPQFEVATIKPFNPHGGLAGVMNFGGGRIYAGHMTVRTLLMIACNVQDFQVKGGPDWIDREFVNVDAKAPEDSPSAKRKVASIREPLSNEQRQMLLALLLERFHLKYRVEQKDAPVYLLERGKGDLKLDKPEDPNAPAWFGGLEGGAVTNSTGIAATNINMPALAEKLGTYFQRPVLDKTGMSWNFDFRYQQAANDPETKSTVEDVTSAIDSSLHGLGLKLTPAKAPVTILVIDSAQEPSAN